MKIASQIMQAHANTLREWADIYSRLDVAGASEVAFQCRRTATIIEAMAQGDYQPEPQAPAAVLDDVVEEARAG